jgi:hypothetical protein
MRGDLPKVGDIIPVLLPGENLMAKIVTVAEPSLFGEELREIAIKVTADQVRWFSGRLYRGSPCVRSSTHLAIFS